MLHIKVVGSGCMNCEKLAAMCQTVIIEKEIEGYVEKITDREKITELGIMMTPGLIINDKVVSSGKIPPQSTLEQWILGAVKNYQMDRIKLQVQFFVGCPNSGKMLETVKAVVSKLGEVVDYEEVIIQSTEDALKYNFRGSPTLLINGKDFETMPVPENPALSCRYYANGLPTYKQIIKKVKSQI